MPAGICPLTCATHDRVLIPSRPQKSASFCSDSVFWISLVSLGNSTPFLHTVLCLGRPGTHTNFTYGFPRGVSTHITVADDAPRSRNWGLSLLSLSSPYVPLTRRSFTSHSALHAAVPAH